MSAWFELLRVGGHDRNHPSPQPSPRDEGEEPACGSGKIVGEVTKCQIPNGGERKGSRTENTEEQAQRAPRGGEFPGNIDKGNLGKYWKFPLGAVGALGEFWL